MVERTAIVVASRPVPRNPRWSIVIAAYLEGFTKYAELAERARVTPATIAKYFADADFARELYVACDAAREKHLARLSAMTARALDVVDESLAADPNAIGKTRRMLAAELVLSRTLPAPRDNGAIAAAAAGGAAGAALASRADVVESVRAMLGDAAAQAARRKLLLDVADDVAHGDPPVDGGEGSGAPAPIPRNP